MTGARAGAAESTRTTIEERLHHAVVVAGAEPARRSLDEQMERQRIPGVSIAVVERGEVAWTLERGVADHGRPVRPDTRFQAASVSKVVATCAALALVERGVLALDDDVNRWLDRWRVPADRFVGPAVVTLRHLLDHTAGVNVTAFDGYAPGSAPPTLTDILEGLPPANSPPVRVTSAPGSRFRYSGGGFTIVELLIEDATGERFADVVRDTVFDPLGMEDSGFAGAPGVGPNAAGHDAHGRRLDGGGRVHPEAAAAGLWSTAGDLARLVVALQRAVRGDRERWLSSSTARTMVAGNAHGRGLGVDLAGAGAAARFRHRGSNRGFRCLVDGFVRRGDGIVVLTNGDGGLALVESIARTAGAAARWPGAGPVVVPPASPCDAGGCAGEYVDSAGEVIRLRTRGHVLVTDSPAGERRVLPLRWRHFVDEETAAEAVFDRRGKPAGFDLVVDGRVVDHPRRVA